MKNEKTSAPQGSSLGVDEGKLAPCKSSPNCVSSQAEGKHYLAPLGYEKLKEANRIIVEIIKELPTAEIVEKKKNYIRAEVRSKLFKFVDDLEFYFSEAEKKIHFRSAARSGYWDLGVNKRRIKDIKEKYAKYKR